jgi:hypothetical protein
MLAPNTQSTTQLIPHAIHTTRLLFVSDCMEHLCDLRNTNREFDITAISPSEDVTGICQEAYDVVILDVPATALALALKAIRASERNARSLVLVEASRVSGESNLAGVLPRYRAMPCSLTEMIALLRQSAEPRGASRHARGML